MQILKKIYKVLMVRTQTQSSKFKLYQFSMLGIVFLIILSIFSLAYQKLRYAEALENRERSIRLVAELRQSSNDLARLVRTYVITGDPVYKQQFQLAIDIRNGNSPRPKNYSLAYWDIKALDGSHVAAPEEYGDSVSLIEMMRQAGVVEEELDKLKSSKENSDALILVEKRAIQLIDEGGSTPAENREQALAILANQYFVNMKASIMRPIIDAEKMIADRTQRSVDGANNRLISIIVCLIFLVSLLMFLIYKVGRQLNLILGCSISELQIAIKELGKGNFLTAVNPSAKNPESVLAWLERTRRKLSELNLSHFKAIVDSSDDAIISKDINGVIASWNHGAEKIFGYSESEMIGKPMLAIIPLERIHEEPEILRKIAAGEKIDHFQTQRLNRFGDLVDVSVTVSPIYNSEFKVIGASKIARDISKAKAAEAEIHRLAFFDVLTGLVNRRLLQDRLASLYSAALRDNLSFAVAFIDLDNFKSLNDSKGHDAGDILLKEVARRLSCCVRESDTVARFGGDEFILLLRGPESIDPENFGWVDLIISKIICDLSKRYVIQDGEHWCTTSIGVSVFDGHATDSVDFIRQADQAMYLAKAAGKNRYKIYNKN